MASASPCRRLKLTPSTAFTVPKRLKQYVWRSSTSSMTSPICRGMHAVPLLDELHELEMRRAAGGGARVDPAVDDFRIGEHLVAEPEERYVGELLEDVIADRLHQLVAVRLVRR